MRYVWQPEIDNRLISKPFGKLFLNYLKNWDLKTNKNVDYFLTNSKTVQARIKKFYGRNATVIYPPVSLNNNKPLPKEDYYLMLGRLIPYKKVDLAIKACQKEKVKLLVAGDGPEKSYLERIASDNIKFLGRVNNEEKLDLLLKAKALIFPGEEDFGIVPIEALSSGTPVIAYGKGGATEYIKDGKNGILFKEQSIESLTEALKKFDRIEFDKRYIIKSATKFSKDRFKNEIKEFIERI
jgi:glycosyltransferase involved in cell wall biosynthesis